MPGWKVFIARPTEFCRKSLRRYASDSKCPSGPMSYHDASVVIEKKVHLPKAEEGAYRENDRTDPRWPTKCRCGYAFSEKDYWQTWVLRLYDGSPDGKLRPIRELPPGGAWVADWFDHPKYRGPDGKVWAIMFPGGVEWIVYGPSSDKKWWDITGTMPEITVSPSIGIGKYYHGFLKKGVIGEDVDGRKFPGIPRTA